MRLFIIFFNAYVKELNALLNVMTLRMLKMKVLKYLDVFWMEDLQENPMYNT